MDRGPVSLGEDRLALGGYDPVSYVDSPMPLEGSPQITAGDRGAVYRFVSEKHRELFIADPQRYEPAYGGFCAAGVAHGYKVKCDPADYKLDNGKLYLFNKTFLFDASRGWDANEKQAADRNWRNATGG